MADVRRVGAAARSPAAPSGLGLYFFVLLLLLYLPIALLLLFSVNDNTTLTFPLRGLTGRWYAGVLAEPGLLRAARNSRVVAAGSSLVATLLGTMAALLVARFTFRAKLALVSLAVLPLIVPFVVLGASLLLLFSAAGIDRSLGTVGAAHTVISIPYVLLIVASRLAEFDPSLEEAAMDLGADYLTTLRRVVVPIIAPAVASAALVAFTVSFDEFALALFLAGRDPTFPVYLLGQLRFANRLPILISLAMVMTVGTLLLALAAERLRRAR